MKCPLLLFEQYTTFDKIGTNVADCLQEKCAWWDENGSRCAILEISRELCALGNTLGRVNSKIPLGGVK